MNIDYAKILSKIEKIILIHGIPIYVKKWKKLKMPNRFTNYQDFIEFLNNYVSTYHIHSYIKFNNPKIKNNDSINDAIDRKMPKMKYNFNDKIGMITFYHFYNGPNNTINNKDGKKIIDTVKNELTLWNKFGLKGLIIDLRKHYGGDMWIAIKALQDIFGNVTLLSFNDKKTKFVETKWINMVGGEILFNQKYLPNKLAFSKPISVIVSNKTTSSGEFIASVFYNRLNTKIFGYNTPTTAGYLSSNTLININKNLTFVFTNSLCTTADGTFHINEYIKVNNITSTPIMDAKEWIISY